MSILGDAVQTLNEDIEVTAFLPGVNYVFLHIASGGGSDFLFALALTASIVGAALFNHLRFLGSDEDTDDEKTEGVEEGSSKEWDDPRNSDHSQSVSDREIGQERASMLLLIMWGGLLLTSMYFLLERFSRSWVLPEILFFTSTGLIALYVTDAVLKEGVSDYDG
jgi:hypothetical protein